MRLILPAVALGCLALVLYRSVAFGRKQAETDSEHRIRAWGGVPKAYRYTYEGKPYRHRLFTRIRRAS